MIYRILVFLLGLYTGEDASVQHAAGQGQCKGSQGSSNRKWGRCRRCRVREVNLVFLPCGHAVCCAECGVISSTCDIYKHSGMSLGMLQYNTSNIHSRSGQTNGCTGMMLHVGSLLDVDLALIPRAFVRDRNEEECPLLARDDGGDKSGLGIQELVRLSYRPPGKYPLKPDSLCDERLQTLRSGDDDLAAMPPEKIRLIARAGFYRCGKTTTLTCFHCGCQATNWRVDDDPWDRHAELQPNCPVVKRGVVICREGERPVDRVMRRRFSS